MLPHLKKACLPLKKMRLSSFSKKLRKSSIFSPNLEPLVVLAVAVHDDVHQLKVGHADVDQAVDDPLLGELQPGVPVLVWNYKIA
jgi:hypothetical protein